MILTNGQVQPTSSFVPKSLVPALPPLLSELYNSRFLSASFSELLTVVNISVTPAQHTAVEEGTRDQLKSHLWFNIRTQRVTASKLRAVCVTDETMPSSSSLIMSCCYPEVSQFKRSATVWGCEHESEAREKYKLQSSLSHKQLSIDDCGFFIHPEFSHCPDCCKLPQFKRRKL